MIKKVDNLKNFIELNSTKSILDYLSQNIDEVWPALEINPELIEVMNFVMAPLSYEQQSILIERRFYNFQKIKDLHENLQVMVVTNFARNLFSIHNPCEKAFLSLFNHKNMFAIENDFISLDGIIEHCLRYRSEFLTSRVLSRFHSAGSEKIKNMCLKHPNWKNPASLILEEMNDQGQPDSTT